MRTKGRRQSTNVEDRRAETSQRGYTAKANIAERKKNLPDKVALDREQNDYLRKMARDIYDDDPEIMEKNKKRIAAQYQFHKKRGDFYD